MKKLLSMTLALVMVCGLSVPAFAAGQDVIDGNDSNDYSTTVE